jgi:hypothetical protein
MLGDANRTWWLAAVVLWVAVLVAVVVGVLLAAGPGSA